VIAQLSVETGIAPNDLLDAPDGMIDAMIDVLQQRAEAQRKAMGK
jgi:hypothetical protein